MEQATILVVDDEIIIARELEARLKGLGYGVAGIASSGAEAVRLAVDTNPTLVLMDVVLKGDMDGIEAATEIRRRCHIPVIYLTAYTDKKTLERAKITEPFAYIVKPFTERELSANIEVALYKNRAETRLRRLERWLTASTEATADAVVAADQNGLITIFNPAAEALTEWRADQANGKKLQDVLRLVDRGNSQPVALDPTEGPVVCLADNTGVISKSGRVVPVDSTTSCVRDELNHPTGTVSVVRRQVDVAERKRLEGEVRQAQQRLQRVVTSSPAVLYTLSGDSGASLVLTWISENVTEMMGYPLDEVYHPDWWKDRLHPEDLNLVFTELQNVLFARGRLLQEYRFRRRDDEYRWVRSEMRLLRDDSGDPLEVVGSWSDITEHKQLEQQFRQAQKMEAIGQLAGGVAHDFNNLLTVISGCSQLLLAAGGLDERKRGLIGEIGKAGERAATLTRQLLAFSRKQVLESKVLSLNTLIADQEKMLRRLIGEDVEVSIVPGANLNQVKADIGQMEQVIINLAVNARDAMPQGGRLTIETSNAELDESYAKTRPEVVAGKYVLVSMSDTGIGMSPDTLARIFEPFYTTKGLGKGTGLGLATVHGIIKQSNGHIAVYSEPGVGTSFKIYLPSVRERHVREESTAPSKPSKGTETILLVEDEGAVRAIARYALESCGYVVLEAGNGAEALRVCERYEGTIHLVVTDVVMPEMGGRPLVERLTKLRSGVKVLFTSGYTDDAVIRHGVLEAATAFIQKPFTPEALANKVRQVLDEHGTRTLQ